MRSPGVLNKTGGKTKIKDKISVGRNLMKLNQLAWCFAVAGAIGLAPAVYAQTTVVSDTTDNLGSKFFGVGNDMAETFNTGTASGDISQITLSLNFAGATQTGIFLYTNSGAPASYETLQIGTVSTSDYVGQNSSGQNLYNVELNPVAVAANPLAADTDYSISVEGQGAGDSLDWWYTADGAGFTGTGSYLGTYYVDHGSWVSAPSQMQGVEIDVAPAPEPGEGTLMILGAMILPGLAGKRIWKRLARAV
jgi:hypothetical protein